MAAALCLGASGINVSLYPSAVFLLFAKSNIISPWLGVDNTRNPLQMGTRFMCTIEAPIHQNIKEQIVKSQETDTALVLRRWKNTTRLYKNKVTDQALKVEQESKTGDFTEIAPFVSGQRGRQVFLNGDPEYGVSNNFFLPQNGGSSDLLEYEMLTCNTFVFTGLDRRSSHRTHSRYPIMRGSC